MDCCFVRRSRPLFTARRLALDISRSAIFRFMRAELSRSAEVGRRDFVGLSSSEMEVAESESVGVDVEGGSRSDDFGEILGEDSFSGGDIGSFISALRGDDCDPRC